MCGIVGLVGRLEPEDGRRIEAMSAAVAHRGPDAAQTWRSEQDGHGVWFGHRRLSIIDLRAIADQPLIDRASGVALIFNGEIYNFTTIRASAPYPAKPISPAHPIPKGASTAN